MASGVAMEVGDDGVAVITISNPPVNALSPSITECFKARCVEAMSRDDIKAIVLTGNAGKFSAGFDINVFTEVHKTGDLSLIPDISAELVSKVIEDGKKPYVAAIQGVALGGGLELAMGCHARISTPEAQLGLPELTLGVIPGLGGTQRLPRLVGLPKALEMLLLSKTIRASEGKEYGLVDAIASPEELIGAAKLWALDIVEGRKPCIRSLHRNDKLGSLSESREVLEAARQQAMEISPDMPQHQVCLDAIEEGIVSGGYAGIVKETKLFRESTLSSISRGFVYAFFAQRVVSKVNDVTDVGLKPRQIKKVAVIGGCILGSGIATALILNNISVILKEIDSSFRQSGMEIVEANLEGLVKTGSLSRDKMSKALSLLKGVLDYSEFKHVDMVIETVTENVGLNQSIFVELEKICSPECIFATNTSTTDLYTIGKNTSSQDRIVGVHFFSPAHIMPLVEIVRTEKTSPQVILDLMTIGKTMKKVAVVVSNCRGLGVKRALFPYMQGAELLVHLGVDLFKVDSVITSFGMPMGPFQLQDFVGYEGAVAVREVTVSAFKGRSFDSDLLDLMIKDGREGKSSGKGYYIYEKDSKSKPDPSVQAIVEESRRHTNIMPGGKPITVSDQDILDMVFFPVVNEACRILDEGVVARASDLDIACVIGMSFPKYRGGIIFWADSIGAGHIYSRLKEFEEEYGSFFKPSPYLEQRALKGFPLSMTGLSS